MATEKPMTKEPDVVLLRLFAGLPHERVSQIAAYIDGVRDGCEERHQSTIDAQRQEIDDLRAERDRLRVRVAGRKGNVSRP